MTRSLRIISFLLLLLNGIGALFGGILLMADPSGDLIGYPLSFLEHSPFRDFLLPGLILFVFNGVFSIGIAILAIRKVKYYPFLIAFQGFVLVGWILIEVWMIRIWYAPLHLTFLAIGGVLVLAGSLLLYSGNKYLSKESNAGYKI